MRLSAKSRFAVGAMIDLALRETTGPVPLNSIGLRLQISLSYLEQLFSKLRQYGLVESTRGPGGGYTLGRNAQQISVADIIRAVEGARALQADASTDAGEAGWQLTQDLWSGLNSRMMEHLQSIKLQQLCEEQRAKGVQVEARPASRRGIFAQRKLEPVKTTAPNSVFALAGALAGKQR
ncbi:MAG: Rrf2 family transcriptional regulator [Hylemonella sp.]|nr:Rrf2 family transcriptional regulator [Hylemonella sp.]